MEKLSSFFVRARRSLAASLVFATSVIFVAPDLADSASNKITLCHRTRSVTNPYRRITVNRNAVNNSGHGNASHSGPVFVTTAGYYNTNPKNWGDIIPGGDADGLVYNGAESFKRNWDAAGKAIFLPNGANASLCSRMTAKQFYDVQIAAGESASSIIDDLNDMEANEDVALLASLGGSFSSGNLSSWDTAITVDTTAATSVSSASASAVLNASIKFANNASVRWYFEYSTDSSMTSPLTSGTYDAPYSVTANGSLQTLPGKTVSSLNDGTWYFRVVAITGYGLDTEGILYGDVENFTISRPSVTTNSLPGGQVGTAYSQTLTSTGGTGSRTNYVRTTGSLPTSLTLNSSTGEISGTPTVPGLYSFSVTVDDSATPAVTSSAKALTIRITGDQTISFPSHSKTYGDAPFAIGATTNVTPDETTSSGSFTSYSSSTTGVCTVNASGQVTIVAQGTCTISVTHSGNNNWNSKTDSTTFTVSPRAITVKADNKSKIVNGTEPTPTVSVTVGSLVSPDVLSGATFAYTGGGHSAPATIPNVVGSYTITPSAATFSTGSASNYTINYDTGTLTVSATATAQTIDFPDPADKTWGDPAFTIGATSKDGSTNTDLLVTFTSNTPLVCTVGTASKASGVSTVTVTIVKAGTCTIETTQTGGSNGSTTYSAATPVTQSIVISPRAISLKADDKSKTVDGTNPSFSYTLTVGSLAGSDAISSVTYTHSSSSYTASTTVPNVVGSYTITPSAAVFSSGLAANYVITYLTGTLTVSAASTTTSSAAPTTAAPTTVAATATTTPKVDPRKTTDNPFVNISAEPKPNSTNTGGTLEIDGDPAMQVLSVTSSDPNVTVEAPKTGVEYNKPETWVAEGFGDECWKIEPGGSAYILPAVPTPPSGRAGFYSLVKVKAGSLTSTDPNFQVNTIFASPKGGDRVWPDSNRNGIYDAGGRTGDKDISHVILCIRYGSPSTTTTAPAGTAGSTTSSTVAGGTSTTVGSGSSTTSTAPSSTTSAPSSTTAAPSSTATTVAAGPTTTAGSGATTPTTARPGTTTTTLPIDAKDDDGPRDNILIRVASKTTPAPTQPVVVTMRMTTGTEESIVKLSVDVRTMEVAKVQAVTVSAVDVDTVSAASNVVVRTIKTSKAVLPATGSESGSMLPWVFLLIGLGMVVRLFGRWVARR